MIYVKSSTWNKDRYELELTVREGDIKIKYYDSVTYYLVSILFEIRFIVRGKYPYIRKRIILGNIHVKNIIHYEHMLTVCELRVETQAP